MGSVDILQKDLLRYEDVFVDVFKVLSALDDNGYCKTEYREELGLESATQAEKTPNLEAQDFSQEVFVGGIEMVPEDPNSSFGANVKIRDLHRDVFMGVWRDRIKICYLGIENQSAIDSKMPLRVCKYDISQYDAQCRKPEGDVSSSLETGASAGQDTDITLDEDSSNELSSILPVVTMVLYFGTKRRWNKPLCLKDCLNLKNIPRRITDLVSDYKMNLYQIAFLPIETIKLFRSDFIVIADYLCQKREFGDYDKTRNGGIGQNRKFKYPYETLNLLYQISKDERFIKVYYEIKDQQGGFGMCEVLDKIEARGKDKGRAEGRAEGRVEGRAEGFVEGEVKGTNKMKALVKILLGTGRVKDLTRAVEDEAYCNKLYAEFKLA